MKLVVLTEAILMLTDMGNELGDALSDNKIQFSEWFKIGAPLLRLPGILAKKEQLIKELKQWTENERLRIELMKEVQNRLDIPQSRAEAIIRESIIFYYSIESFIANLRKIAAGQEVPNHSIAQNFRAAPSQEFIYWVRVAFGFDHL